MPHIRCAPLLVLLALAPLQARAGTSAEESAPPAVSAGPAGAAAPDAAAPGYELPSLMRRLASSGLHELVDERWNASGQITVIGSYKPSFAAAYTNLNGSSNSLSPDAETGFTTSATLFFGLRLWHGGEAWFVPELIAEQPFSGLHGLGGAIQNFELQKTGGTTPQLYRSRLFLRQTFGLGGATEQHPSDQMQLGATVDRRRVTVTVGNFTILDVFDKNSFTTDTRQLFLGLAFMTHAAWDFASDARGYSWGGMVELNWDEWALRLGRISPPIVPNQLQVGLRLDRHYGDQLELEHDHKLLGQDGAVRLLAFRNHERMGRFDDAVADFLADPSHSAANCGSLSPYGSTNAQAPDLCWVRRDQVKVGIGINLEQHLSDDAGLFLRALWADGQTEVQAYTSSDRSLSLGAVAHGSSWGRPGDVTGAGAAFGWISGAHARYLALGGIDGFVGDGGLHQATEATFEAFYSLNPLPALWLTGDYQRIWNPAFNADRGPVNVLGVRLHAQY